MVKPGYKAANQDRTLRMGIAMVGVLSCSSEMAARSHQSELRIQASADAMALLERAMQSLSQEASRILSPGEALEYLAAASRAGPWTPPPSKPPATRLNKTDWPNNARTRPWPNWQNVPHGTSPLECPAGTTPAPVT